MCGFEYRFWVKLIFNLTVIAYHCCIYVIVVVLYLRYLLIVDATDRNSLISGRGRHFTEL